MDLAGLRRAAGLRPHWTDLAIGLGLAATSIVTAHFSPLGEPQQDVTGYHFVVAAVAFAAVMCRRRAPWWVLTGTTVVSVPLTILLGSRPLAVTAALMVAIYTIAQTAGRRTVWLTTIGVFLIGWLAHFAAGTDSWWDPGTSVDLGFLGMAAAYGDAARSRRAYIAAVEDRATRAEQTREEEARRRVAQERLRIARELHDVAAHHIAVVKVQATGARHVGPGRPDQVAQALDAISRFADAALREMAFVVGLLRDSGDPAAPTRPPCGLAQVTDLLEDIADHLTVEHRESGDARQLPSVVDVAAYRIVLEALTNARKYGDGTADLTVTYTPQAVTLDITNPVSHAQSGQGSGYGILGMCERAAAIGGSVTAGMDGPGRFAVHACLPTHAVTA
ncbi:histidine kinase [Actinocrispum sp. NPDC049592]|uniref:sensor histidine kinase n=1 Tax=Actinocrispum sp. NPDC049592 TaxID=3154835 RepID=UPI00342E5F49